MTGTTSGTTNDVFRIGRDAGPVGRVLRLLVGVAGLGLMAHRLDGRELPYLGWLALFTVALAAGYVLVWYLLGDRFFGRVSPWISSAVLLSPTVVYAVNPGGSAFFNAIALYMSLSLLVNAATGYGGTEPAGVPALLLGRRYPTYSPFNTMDLVERACRRPEARHAAGAGLSAAALTITAAVFYFFWIVPIIVHVPFFRAAAVVLPGPAALALLLPAALFAYRAVRRRDRVPALAAAVTTLLTPAFAVMSAQGAGLQGMLWGLIALTGLVVGLVTLARRVIGSIGARTPEEKAEEEDAATAAQGRRRTARAPGA